MADIIHKYKNVADEVFTYIDYPLVMKSDDGNDYYIRHKETNLGDLCADAYRQIMGADIALVDAGSFGDEITDNGITYNDIKKIFPYNQQPCLINATGRMIVDALELGASHCPSPNRGFLQVSGIKFTINTSIPPAVYEENSNLVYNKGEYRVRNVEVFNKETGEYEAIDLEKEYTVAMSNYMYKELSGTFLMFQGCTPVLDEELTDAELMLKYLAIYWGTNLPEEYSNPDGGGRIELE